MPQCRNNPKKKKNIKRGETDTLNTQLHDGAAHFPGWVQALQ